MKKGIDALTARELQVMQSAARGESARNVTHAVAMLAAAGIVEAGAA